MYFICVRSVVEHVLGSLELIGMGIVGFTHVLSAFLSFPKGGIHSVADLGGDAPWPWEGVGGRVPRPLESKEQEHWTNRHAL